MMKKFFLILSALILFVSGGVIDQSFSKTDGGTVMELQSSAFKNKSAIPSRYTCDGANVSPPLAWEVVPEGVKSFALISDDPDAPVGTWFHWVYYNIPPEIKSLPENVAAEKKPAVGGMQGINDFRKIGYGGPCPPGGTHRYFFKIYALDTMLNLSPGATKKELVKAMEGHILGHAELIGTYKRR
ncbi:MAG: YbhB/YbcL family Raf kinase inhibitor-like protein [bacterium]